MNGPSASLKYVAIVLLAAIGRPAASEPVAVRHISGFIHGYAVLKDLDDRILASGEITQNPSGEKVSVQFNLRFRDSSRYEETAVFSQRRVFRLLKYTQVQKGPAFKYAQTLNVDTESGTVSAERIDEDGKLKTVVDHLDLPPDLANGILPMLMVNVDPRVETTLSMLVATPKPRVVKLKISAAEQEHFFIGNARLEATHYLAKIDIGGVTGAVAKVAGKQPSPINFWVATGRAPAFLKSEGPLYEDGPDWRIELASPRWPADVQKR